MFEGKKVGLSLSGGGMRGIAHIGALKALEEYHIKPSIIAGTSIGAIVGSLYCAKNSPEEILEKFRSISIFSIRNYAHKEPGLIRSKAVRKEAKDALPNSFENLEIPLVVNATNLLTGRQKVFTEGDLLDIIMASFAFPGMFPPVKIGDDYYVDGGVTNNFPIELIEYSCDIMIGSYVNPLKKITPAEISSAFVVLERVMEISMHQRELESFHKADILIVPEEISQYPLFSFKNIDVAYKIGYDEAIKQIKRYIKQTR